jgi:hypothetical protein
VAEWDTQWFQKPPPERDCGFESRLRHRAVRTVGAVAIAVTLGLLAGGIERTPARVTSTP